MGLELKPSKTRISHTLASYEGAVGFDFLGFTIRHYPAGKCHTGRATNGAPLGFKTNIKPSSTKQQQHYTDLAAVIDQYRQAPQGELIDRLNPKIVGWANYYATVRSTRVFSRVDALLYWKLKHWAERRHPTKNHSWVARHYWRPRGNRRWVFAPAQGKVLAFHADTHIHRHTKVKGAASFFDGNVVYWASRLGRHPELPNHQAELLKRQQGRCAWCGLLFTRIGEVRESDHMVPASLGGQHGKDNRQLLHGHCHDAKTALDGSNRSRTTRYPSQGPR